MVKPTFNQYVTLPACGLAGTMLGYWAMENFFGVRIGGGGASRGPMSIWIPIAGIVVGFFLCWIYYRQRCGLFEYGVDAQAELVRFTGGGGALVKYNAGGREYQKIIDIPREMRKSLHKGSILPVRVHRMKPALVQFAGELAL